MVDRISRIASFALAIFILIGLTACSESESPDSNIMFDMEVSDTPYEFVFDYNRNMQLPELPTGCEATAAATLAQMNGAYEITKEYVADRMPKSDTDFVNAFIGDPYSAVDGWATSAPCVTNTLNEIFSSREQYAAINLTGTDLYDLPLPVQVWTTIDQADQGSPVLEQDGYGLFYNTHCVVIIGWDDLSIHVLDPLAGITEYPAAKFEKIYNTMGKQAVYVDELDVILRIMRGDYDES